MDRNSIIGLVLIFLILITFAYINQPSQAELDQAKHRADSIALARQTTDSVAANMMMAQSKKDTVRAADSTSLINAYGSFASFSNGKEEITTLENDEVKIDLTNKGGRIYRVQLKKFKRSDGSPLVLMDGPENEFEYSFATRDAKAISSKDLYFSTLKGADGKSVSMFVKLADQQYIEHRFSLNENQNMVDFKLSLVGMENVIASNSNFIDLNWKQHMLLQEKTIDAENRTTTVYYRYLNEDAENLTETKDSKEDLNIPVQWVSFKQQYFNLTLISDNAFEKNSSVESKQLDVHKNADGKEVVTLGKYTGFKTLSASLALAYNHGAAESYGMKFYFGPNHYKSLEKLNIGLEKIVPMGWGIFGWVNKYLTVNVFYFLGQYILNFGLIIFLLTLIVKTILFPLVYKSYQSSAKMRVLKPEMDELKAKYGNDMTKLQQENMKLYRKAGVNPMGGCVPVLLQMPILIAMFQFFPSAFELRQKAFLWSHDLSSYDSILNLPFNVPFYGDHVSLFTLLMTISTLVYTMYNNQMTGVTGQMKYISYLMPIVFLGFFNNYASGLTYYYFLSNLFTIGQQLLIRTFVDDKALHAQIQENKKKPVVKSKFQLKLEEMARKRGIDTDKLGK